MLFWSVGVCVCHCNSSLSCCSCNNAVDDSFIVLQCCSVCASPQQCVELLKFATVGCMTYSLCAVTHACIKRNTLKMITLTNQFLSQNLSYFSVNVRN
mmetsp:Transcript_29679/g.47782  ORF Transcript_29679/g.47782 Transcript_29679/m.47782 type:complete len:98 (-) Transcript_29679:54-347(-)